MQQTMQAPGLADIETARRRIAAQVRTTPVVPLTPGLQLKAECLQWTGAFKIRGALNAVAAAGADALRDGVSTMSAGNHGVALATAAGALGAPCRVYVPEKVVAAKVRAMEAAGAEVVPIDNETLGRWLRDGRAEDDRVFVPPFAHPDIVAGQGTIGLEILEQVPDVRTVFVPIGGGGLSLGVATAVKAKAPDVRVIGVTAAKSPAIRRALRDDAWDIVRPTSIADGLGSPIAVPWVVEGLRGLLDEVVVVDDDAIRAAMGVIAKQAKLVAEPAGAAATAAALQAELSADETEVAIVSGGNVDPALLASVLDPVRAS